MIKNGMRELLEELQTMTAREWISDAAWAVLTVGSTLAFVLGPMLLPEVIAR